MNKRIIYKTDDGSVSVITPTDEALTFTSVQEIAKKDVPPGLAYKIVDVSEIPEDRTFRDAWTVDESLLTDGFGLDYGVGSNNDVTGWNEDGTPVTNA